MRFIHKITIALIVLASLLGFVRTANAADTAANECNEFLAFESGYTASFAGGEISLPEGCAGLEVVATITAVNNTAEVGDRAFHECAVVSLGGESFPFEQENQAVGWQELDYNVEYTVGTVQLTGNGPWSVDIDAPCGTSAWLYVCLTGHAPVAPTPSPTASFQGAVDCQGLASGSGIVSTDGQEGDIVVLVNGEAVVVADDGTFQVTGAVLPLDIVVTIGGNEVEVQAGLVGPPEDCEPEEPTPTTTPVVEPEVPEVPEVVISTPEPSVQPTPAPVAVPAPLPEELAFTGFGDIAPWLVAGAIGMMMVGYCLVKRG